MLFRSAQGSEPHQNPRTPLERDLRVRYLLSQRQQLDAEIQKMNQEIVNQDLMQQDAMQIETDGEGEDEDAFNDFDMG